MLSSFKFITVSISGLLFFLSAFVECYRPSHGRIIYTASSHPGQVMEGWNIAILFSPVCAVQCCTVDMRKNVEMLDSYSDDPCLISEKCRDIKLPS